MVDHAAMTEAGEPAPGSLTWIDDSRLPPLDCFCGAGPSMTSGALLALPVIPADDDFLPRYIFTGLTRSGELDATVMAEMVARADEDARRLPGLADDDLTVASRGWDVKDGLVVMTTAWLCRPKPKG